MMMKTLKTILITLFVTLSFVTCKKDEKGQWIQYYKNKTGVGYVFYKWDNDSIAPIPNLQMQIKSNTRGELFAQHHSDYIYTDNTGKYVFKLVKKIDNSQVVSAQIIIEGNINPNPYYYSDRDILIPYSNIENQNKITIDTILCFIH